MDYASVPSYLKWLVRQLASKLDLLLAHSSNIGVELENDLARLSMLDPILIILDVGANHGQSAIRYARAFKQARIFCFEPVFSNYKVLSLACSQHPRIELVQKGLSDKPGTGIIGLTDHPGGHSLLLSSTSDKTEKVSITTIDSFLLDSNIKRIDLLKIDVEGSELSVLKGALAALESSAIRYIYAECITLLDPIEPHTLFSDLTSFLHPYGLVVFAIYHESFHLDTGSALINVLFVNMQFLPESVPGNIHNIV